MKKNKGNGILKFLAGVGIGTGIGLLFAPKTGEETRKDLKKKLDEFTESLKEIDVNEVKDEFLKKIEEIKTNLEDLDKEKAEKIAKKKVEELKNKVNELVEMAKEKGTPVLEQAANEVKAKAINVTKDVLKKLES